MRLIGIIPARYESTRFPGKPLKSDTGKYLLQHTYEQAVRASALDQVIIATDDERIERAARSFGAECRMTSPECLSGGDRVAEVAATLNADVFINIQGDEPEIDPEHIDLVATQFLTDETLEIASLATPIEDREDFEDPNVVKVVINRLGYAMYFSRATIPSSGFVASRTDETASPFLRHVGLYGYRQDVLLALSRMEPTVLEKLENLEQLRALDAGFDIRITVVKAYGGGIDTPEDYMQFVERMTGQSEQASL